VAAAKYSWPNTNLGGFTVSALLVENRTTPGGPIIDPVDVRLQFRIESFWYLSNNLTMLALDARWQTPMLAVAGELNTLDEGLGFRHAWDSNATINAAPVSIGTTVHSYGRTGNPEEAIFFAYPNGTNIRHDTTLGAFRLVPNESSIPEGILRSIQGSWPLYLVGLVGTAALVAGPIYWRRQHETGAGV
jgi:hypothetical protein